MADEQLSGRCAMFTHVEVTLLRLMLVASLQSTGSDSTASYPQIDQPRRDGLLSFQRGPTYG
jgi:hypothetical protein